MSDAPRIDHIGVVVDDLEAAKASFERMLGVAPSMVKKMPEVGLYIARFETTNVAIELIQYTDDGDGFGRAVMGSETGFNHISFEVDDVSEAVERFADAGLEPQEGFPRQGSTGPVSFFEKDPVTGLLLEVSQHQEEENR